MTRLLCTALILLALGTARAESPPPNIVVLVGDDVGFSDLGSFGGEIDTPHLDALAAEGLRFANFHASGMCAPSRAMLMTGVDHHRAGVGNMPEALPASQRGAPGYEGVLNDAVATLGERLREAGYRTYHIGKWHLGKAPHQRPYARGFERSIAMADTGADNWEQRTYLPMYDRPSWFADGQPHTLPDDFYSSRYFVDKAVQFIEEDRASGRPFFAYIGVQAVHSPLQAPQAFVDKYRERYRAGWDALRESRHRGAIERGVIPAAAPLQRMAGLPRWDELDAKEKDYKARQMAVYAGMLDAMDHHIGRLVSHLKATGDYANTVFVFLSDNGPEPSYPLDMPSMKPWLWLQDYATDSAHLGAKGTYTAVGPAWASASAAPGREYKFHIGEGALRVPLILRLPDGRGAGRVYRRFTHIQDVAPTLLALAGADPGATRIGGRSVLAPTGASLLPALAGQPVRDESAVLAYELAGNAAVFRGPYKALRSQSAGGRGPWRLYDILEDPGETRDLSGQSPALLAELEQAYAEYAASHGVLPMAPDYHYQRQVMINGARAYVGRQLQLLATLLAVLALVILWRRRRRRT